MTKKKRGRPVGTGENSDLQLMPRIADLIVREQMIEAEAIRLVYPKATDPSHMRRIQRKFKTRRDGYLAEAVARRNSEETRRATRVVDRSPMRIMAELKGLTSNLSAAAELKRQLDIVAPNLRAAAEWQMNSEAGSVMRRAFEAHERLKEAYPNLHAFNELRERYAIFGNR